MCTAADIISGVLAQHLLSGSSLLSKEKLQITLTSLIKENIPSLFSPTSPSPSLHTCALSFFSTIPDNLGILQSPLTLLEHLRKALIPKVKPVTNSMKRSRKIDTENLIDMSIDERQASIDAHLFYSLSVLVFLDNLQRFNDLTKAIDSIRRSVLLSNDKLRPWQAVMSINTYPIGKDYLYIIPSPVIQVDRNSSFGLLFRRILVATDAYLFDGWNRLWQDLTLVARPQIRAYVNHLLQVRINKEESTSNIFQIQQVPPSSPNSLLKNFPAVPSALRTAFIRSVELGDLPTAQDALMSYFDHGFGQSVAGAASTRGLSTSIGISTGDPSSKQGAGSLSSLVGPLARVKELMISAYSAAPVGGAALGRSLMQYPLLAHAAMHAHFGHPAEAVDALHECMRVAQASGDAACASYILQQLAEFTHNTTLIKYRGMPLQTHSHVETNVNKMNQDEREQVRLTAEGVDLLRRVRLRASDLGLWRQQASASLELIEHAVLSEVRAIEGVAQRQHRRRKRREQWFIQRQVNNLDDEMEIEMKTEVQDTLKDSNPPPPLRIALPDWLSVDPYTSFRNGGYLLGATSASSGSGSGIGSGSSSAAAAAASPISPGITTASKERDGIGSSAVVALMSATASEASSALRRSRALGDKAASTSVGVAVAVDAAGRDAATAVRQSSTEATAAEIAASALGPAALWSHPLPLSWREALQLQAQGHASRERMWTAVSKELHPHAGGYLARISKLCKEEAERNLKEEDGDENDEIEMENHQWTL
jgi:hypothetical protein